MGRQSVEYEWAWETVMEAIFDLDLEARNLNEIVEGIKKDPETFIREVQSALTEAVDRLIETEELCPHCLAKLETGRIVDQRIDGFPLYRVTAYCSECEVEY